LGGVAYYLNLVPKAKSSVEIISDLFFSEGAPLLTEFHRLFTSLYDHPERHLAVIKALSTTRQGLTQKQLFAQVSILSPGGSAVAVLEELENCGFISSVPQFGKKKKDMFYRLTDPFSLFYLKWVDGVKHVDESYWLQKKTSSSYYAWTGYAFENLCFQHYPQLIRAMQLGAVAVAKSGWHGAGVQIDLIIDRADRCVNLCEIKFWDDEFIVTAEYAKALKEKKRLFREQTQTTKTLFTTLITTYGARPDKNYLGSVDSQLSIDALMSTQSL
jgi:hypothetical protein